MYRISALLRLDHKLLHTNDLAVLWGIANRKTLYTTISRCIDRGVLFPIYKGLYSVVPIPDLDPIELGRAVIHSYTYLTTETVLSQAGVISQAVYDYTFVAHQSRRITIGAWSFRFRQLKTEFLYHPAGIISQDGTFMASVERAAADILYFDPRYHFDVPEIIDFEKVRSIQIEIGYPHDQS